MRQRTLKPETLQAVSLYPMTCKHKRLVLLPEEKKRLRCRRCHLTIEADELDEGHCPECFEVDGKRLYDFEEILPDKSDAARYRCEDCGLIVESGSD